MGVRMHDVELSCSEFKALIKQAGRGAGLNWALAAEAAGASCWQAQHSLLDYEAFFEALGEGKETSAFVVGPSICDFGSPGLDVSAPLVAKLAQPEFVLPFVAALARHEQTDLLLCWNHGAFACSGDLVSQLDESHFTETPELRAGRENGTTLRMVATRITIAPSHLEALRELAGKTFAPATEESRRLGAG